KTDTAMALVRRMTAGGSGNMRELGEYIRMSPVFSGYADSAMLARAREAFSQAPPNQYVMIWRGLIELDMGNPSAARSVIRATLARPDTLHRWGYGARLGNDGLA